MIVARKVLIPTLLFFILVMVGVGAIFYTTYTGRTQEEDLVELQRFEQAVQTQLDGRGQLAGALALQLASDAGLGQTFGAATISGDRAELAQAAGLPYAKFKELYGAAGVQFHLTPATLFLHIDGGGNAAYGANQAAYRLSVVAANVQNSATSGLELGPDGLNIRGVAPVTASKNAAAGSAPAHFGSVEVALPLDKTFISNLKATYGADWNISLSRQAIETVNRFAALQGGAEAPQFSPAYPDGPTSELALQATTRLDPIYAPSEAYRQALGGQSAVTQVQRSEKTYTVMTIGLRDFSGATIGVVDIVSDRTAAVAALRGRLTALLGLGLAALALGSAGLTFIIRRLLRPVQELTVTAAAIAQGDLNRPIPVPTGLADDEIKQLFVSFGSMTRQLRALIGRMEQRVTERTTELETRSLQLRAASEIARDITARSQWLAAGAAPGGQPGSGSAATTLDEILNQAVRQIGTRFDYYEVSVFLVESGGEAGAAPAATLKAATGETGQLLIQKGLALNLDQPGVVSSVIRHNEARIVKDVSLEPSYVQEPLLPETRSEIAVPLRGGMALPGEDSRTGYERTIGVLDVQSRQPSAFDENDAAVLQIIADQLAVAIQNARLIQQLNRTIAELEHASGQYTQQSWKSYVASSLATRKMLGYVYNDQGLQEADNLASGAAGNDSLHIPLRVRQQIIGGIDLRLETAGSGEAAPEAQAELLQLIEESASRMGLVLESTRLLQEARRQAMREQLVGQVASQVRASLDIDSVLQSAAQSIGQALEIDEVEIHIVDPSTLGPSSTLGDDSGGQA